MAPTSSDKFTPTTNAARGRVSQRRPAGAADAFSDSKSATKRTKDRVQHSWRNVPDPEGGCQVVLVAGRQQAADHRDAEGATDLDRDDVGRGADTGISLWD